MSLSVKQIVGLFEQRGGERYGQEAVSQREHALQCAALAEAAGSRAELSAAALMHDLGHLVHDLGDDPNEEGIDDVHQFLALPFLRPVFPDAVLEPIRLHVDAKRYLCAAEPGYWDTLSFASKRSLELQGGVYTAEEATSFIGQAHAFDAVNLRRWDDAAKIPGRATPDLAHFARLLAIAGAGAAHGSAA
jgi:phosphonate degradation associated HDIG domain protein